MKDLMQWLSGKGQDGNRVGRTKISCYNSKNITFDAAGPPDKCSDRLFRYLAPNPGNIYDGLLLHPDNEHIIYPLGSTIVVRHILSRTQSFLRAHQHRVSCHIYLIQLSKYQKTGATLLLLNSPSQGKSPR